MKLRSLAIWDHLCEDDLTYNNVRRAGLSQLLGEVQEHLRRKRYINNATVDVRAVVLTICRPPGFALFQVYAAFRDFLRRLSTSYPTSWNSYFETVIPAETNLSELDFVTINEFSHYISVIGGLELRNKANYDKNKEWQVHALLLEFLGRLESVPSNSWGLLVYQCFTPRLRY